MTTPADVAQAKEGSEQEGGLSGTNLTRRAGYHSVKSSPASFQIPTTWLGKPPNFLHLVNGYWYEASRRKLAHGSLHFRLNGRIRGKLLLGCGRLSRNNVDGLNASMMALEEVTDEIP
jgi:hypothetical protein